MWWLLFFLLSVSPAFSEPVTTANVLPALSAFSTSGSTTSSGGTGNATAGGGTYTSSFDVPLTEGEVQQGFTLNSAVTVNSHSSNAVLATCTSLTQVGDCRDIFRLGLKLFDGTALAADFLHEVELDFGGLRDYTFTDTFAANNFGVLTGEFSLFGIDAGYHSGFYGPVFSDPSLAFAYQTVPVEQQIMDQIIDQIVMETIAPPPPPVEMAPTSQTAGPPPATMTAAMETQEPAPPPPPTIEPIAPPPPPEQQQEEAAAVAEIEAEIQAAEPEPQPAEPETREAAAPQASPEPRQTRQQKVKAAAQRIVKKIAPSQRYSAASQTTMMVVMNLLSGKIATGPAIKDATAATFFSAANVPDGPSMVDRMMHYRIFGHANGLHNALVDSQYRK